MAKTTSSKPAAVDNRRINNAIRMPGYRDPITGVFVKGKVITDPEELAQAAGEDRVDLRQLYERGSIDGDGWWPEAA